MAPLQFLSRISTSFLSRPFNEVYKVCALSQHLKVAPKRPPNAYALFFHEVRPEIPTRSVPEMGRMVGERWRGLDDEKKNEYRLKSEELRAVYIKDKANFLLRLSPSEKTEMAEEIRQKKLAKQKRRKQAENRKLNKPKPGPTSSFACFLKDKEQLRFEQPITKFVKHLAEEWKNLSEEEKLPYQKKATYNRESYQEKLESWEKEMINMGREDLVRKSKINKS